MYGFSNKSADSDLYGEIEQYASRKIDELAEALDVDIPHEKKGNIKKVLKIIWQIGIGAGSLALLLLCWYLIPLKTGLHIRKTCLDKCQQLWNSIKRVCINFYNRIRRHLHLPNIFYEAVNANDNEGL